MLVTFRRDVRHVKLAPTRLQHHPETKNIRKQKCHTAVKEYSQEYFLIRQNKEKIQS